MSKKCIAYKRHTNIRGKKRKEEKINERKTIIIKVNSGKHSNTFLMKRRSWQRIDIYIINKVDYGEEILHLKTRNRKNKIIYEEKER